MKYFVFYSFEEYESRQIAEFDTLKDVEDFISSNRVRGDDFRVFEGSEVEFESAEVVMRWRKKDE